MPCHVSPFQGAGSNPFRASLLDFTNPEAAKWFQNKMQQALDIGESVS